ncbi:MAG: GNAT family N-acetyltransferase [Clostridia bacterium]
MVHGKWFPAGDPAVQALQIKQSVFGVGTDETDGVSQHVVVYREGEALGAARLWWENGAFWLGDVAVLPSARKQGFGDLLVRLLLFKALSHNAQAIRLQATAQTVLFFAQYGFQAEASGGEMFIRGADVQLSHCGGQCEGCDHRTADCTPKALR